MKTQKVLSILVLLSMVLAACSTPTAVVSPPTAVSAPTNAAAPAAATATQPAAQPAAQATATQPAAQATAAPVAPAPTYATAFATVDDYKAATGKSIDKFNEAPILADQVKAGKLPPLEQRLPKDVLVVQTLEGTAAQYGGQLHLIGVNEAPYLYSQVFEDLVERLIEPVPSYQSYYPNIAKGWKLSDDGKTLTLSLRQGMKWSDGVDFNADDFVFWYEDILKNPDYTTEIGSVYKPGGELMGLKKIDDYTLEYSFASPFFRAPEALLSGGGLFAPAHFIKQYLPKYNPDAEKLAKSEKFDTWVLAVANYLQTNMDPKRPTLNPWMVQDVRSDSAVYVRNPYYFKVDAAGNQLPYIDSALIALEQDELPQDAPLRTMSGEIDISIMGLNLPDFPVLKQNEAKGNYKTYLWPKVDTSFAMGFALNPTVKDPVLRPIYNDLRFRQALSLAINRDDITQNVFYGKTMPFTAPVSPVWTGYEDWMGTYYAEHDVAKANALLDDMGLKWDGAHQYRLRSDGKPVSILAEHTADKEVDAILQLVANNWAEIGVKLDNKTDMDNVYWGRGASNDLDVGVGNSAGGDESNARANYPIRLEPPWHWMGTDCCSWVAYPWRLWLDTNGKQGEEPPQQIKDLYKLIQDWLNTPAGTPQYKDLINQIIKINVNNLYYFGTVSNPPRVIVINNRIGNLPGDNTNLIGMFRPYLFETAFIRK